MSFFDREKERKMISDIVKEIRNGKNRCVWIEGKSGTGKSYLAKYVLQKSSLPIFIYDDYSQIYKCNSNDINKEFFYIIKLAEHFQTLYPKEFDKFLTKYFEKLSPVSWLEVLIQLIPDICYTSWAKNILKTPIDKIESPKKMVKERLYSSGLNRFFSEMIIFMISKVMLKDHIVFCIDDACWLDEQSIKTLKMILNLAKGSTNNNFKISLFIVTRNKASLTDFENNYDILEEYINEFYEKNVHYFIINNFNYSTTREYIKSKKGDFIEEKVSSIYKITSGNPQELFQTLKFSNAEIYDLISKQEVIQPLIPNNFISIELLLKINQANSYTFPIVSCLAIIKSDIVKRILILSCKGIVENVFMNTFSPHLYDKCIQLLTENNIISKNHNMELTHDSIKEIVIQYLKNSGDYYLYLQEFTKSLHKLYDESANEITIFIELLRLYNEYCPNKCFDEYKRNVETTNCDNSIIRIVADALTKDLSIYTMENIIKYIIPLINECTLLGYYDLSYQICENVYAFRSNLSSLDLFNYLISFAKVLIDKGFLSNNYKFNAITLLDEAIKCSDLTANEKLESYLITMSAYEHILDFDSIIKLNQHAKSLLSSADISDINKAMFLRNQGLVAPHMFLEKTYLESIEFADHIESQKERLLMLGTCYNNLGLSYLYTGQISKAIESFMISKHNLEIIGFDDFRVINNLGVCYILQNEYQKSCEYFLEAKSLNLSCVFERLCIENNLSVVNWKLNNKDSAFETINTIIKEYEENKKQTNDDLVYSSAMNNRGYFYFDEEDYINAYNNYKMSKFFKYRYNNDLQQNKRDSVMNLCLNKMGIIDDLVITSLDTEDRNTNIFTKLYSVIAFAYYII